LSFLATVAITVANIAKLRPQKHIFISNSYIGIIQFFIKKTTDEESVNSG